MERYEHHNYLTTNKLCPFKLGTILGNAEEICNWHSNVEFIIVTAGEGKIRYGGDDITLKAGDISLINSNVMHRLYTDGEFCYHYFIVGERFCIENGLDISEFILEPKVSDETMCSLYLAVVDRYREKEADENVMSVMALRSAALALISYAFSNYSKPQDSKREAGASSEEYIKRVVSYLNEHYTEALSLDSIASFCGVSKYHLSREFKNRTGQTVFSYMSMLRCKKAAMLLSEGKSVTETAYACGYESLSYFSRAYRKRMGVAPSEYKAELDPHTKNI